MFSKYTGMKLEIHNRRKFGMLPSGGNFKNILLVNGSKKKSQENLENTLR